MGLADLTIGRYYPADSIIHQTDARIKLLSVLLLTIAIFSAKGFYALFFLAMFIFFIFSISRLPFSWMYKAVKPVFYLLLIAFVFQALFTPGVIILRLAFLNITREGLTLGAFVTLRVLLVVITGSVLTFTTQPVAIADAIESLLSPLKVLKVPVHEIALTVTLAIRFIPELLAEAQKIAFAQQARGADFQSGNVFRRAKSLLPLFVPLLVSSFLKADDLGKAMEARAYGAVKNRTKLYEEKIGPQDAVSAIVVLLAALIALFIR